MIGWRGLCLAAVSGWLSVAGTSTAAPLPAVANEGSRLVDAQGKPLHLRGCNLGNYLMLEAWMFGGTLRLNGEPFRDQETLYAFLRKRFGDERGEALIDRLRANYITARDFDLVKSFGFNVIRLPVDYRMLETEDGSPRKDAYKWIDHLIELAEAADVYVILDLHGAPGGQSIHDHTGLSGQNRIWGSAALQQQTVDLWRRLAERYKDCHTIAAYDLMNEPYSDMRSDVSAELAELMPRIARAIRDTGDRHLLFFPGALGGGIRFYGDPRSKGLSGIGFTEHYYPGLFGSKPALETHARLLGQAFPLKRAHLDRLGTPYLVGEFNPVLAAVDPNRMTRAYYDRFEEYGWVGTMWSYKLLKQEGGARSSAWYMVTNARDLEPIDIATDSYEAIDRFFASFAEAPIAVNEPLRDALTTTTPSPLILAKYAPLPTSVPDSPKSDPAGYRSDDVGGALGGHTAAKADGSVVIMASGADIHGKRDAFRFVSRPIGAGKSTETATITSFLDTAEYAKAGLMARWGDSPSAAMVLLNVFPDGTIALMTRATDGASTTETKVNADAPLPVQLRLEVNGGDVVGSWRGSRGDWRDAGKTSVRASSNGRIGFAVCSHNESVFTTVNATLGPVGDALLPATLDGPIDFTASLLENGSFESAGDSDEVAAGWNRWGDWMNRETGWSPVRDGSALIGHHHWQSTGGSAGLWQDVAVTPGRRYTFSISAQHDIVESGRHDAKSIELRLESVTPDGPITLNSRTVDVANLAAGDAWSRPAVSGTATTSTLRVLVIVNAADESPRGGAIKLDAATLFPAADGK